MTLDHQLGAPLQQQMLAQRLHTHAGPYPGVYGVSATIAAWLPVLLGAMVC